MAAKVVLIRKAQGLPSAAFSFITETCNISRLPVQFLCQAACDMSFTFLCCMSLLQFTNGNYFKAVAVELCFNSDPSSKTAFVYKGSVILVCHYYFINDPTYFVRLWTSICHYKLSLQDFAWFCFRKHKHGWKQIIEFFYTDVFHRNTSKCQKSVFSEKTKV